MKYITCKVLKLIIDILVTIHAKEIDTVCTKINNTIIKIKIRIWNDTNYMRKIILSIIKKRK